MINDKKYNVGNIFFLIMALSVLTLFLPPVLVPLGSSTLTLYIGEIFLWLSLSVWLLVVIKKKHFTLNRMGKYSVILVLIGILSFMNVTDVGRYLVGFTTYLIAALIVFMFSDINLSEKKIVKLTRYYVFSGCILSLFIITKILIEYGGNIIVGSKIILAVGASNYLATMLLMTFFISLTNILRNRFSLINILILSLIITGILFTASRTAIFILMGLFPLFVLKDLIFSRKMSLVKKGVSTIIILSGIGLSYLIGRSYVEQLILSGKFSNLSEQNNLLARFDIFRDYAQAFTEHPFLGHGYLNIILPGRESNYAHNIFLQILGDSGVFFLLVFVLLLVSIFKFLKTSYKNVENLKVKAFILGYQRGFFAVLIHGMLEPNFGTKLFTIYTFIGLGIIIASTRLSPVSKEVKIDNQLMGA